MHLNYILILLGVIAIQTHETMAASIDPVQTIMNYGKAMIFGDDDSDPKDGDEDKEDEKKPYMQNETRSLHNETFFSGYFPVDQSQEIFYILFESRSNETKDIDPLVIWLRGEQGCSTTATLFDGMSPLIFGVNETNNQPCLVENPNSWSNFSNVLYIDAPIGTGYSFIR
jgi:carboxypeptidase C (cathepsin A)